MRPLGKGWGRGRAGPLAGGRRGRSSGGVHLGGGLGRDGLELALHELEQFVQLVLRVNETLAALLGVHELAVHGHLEGAGDAGGRLRIEL